MKTLLPLIAGGAVLTLLSFTGCVYEVPSSFVSHSDFNAVTNLTRTGPIPSDIKVIEVENRSGSVRIVGTSNGPTHWTWNLTVHARTDQQAQKGAEAASCPPEIRGDHLRLAVQLPESKADQTFQSDLELRVPVGVSVHTRNAFGRTEISGITGDADVSGQSGAIEINNVKGKVQAHTSFGKVTIRETGPASVRSQSGSIEASNIHGALDAQTSFASIQAKDIEGAVTLHNQSGRIELENAKGDANLESSFGSLSARSISGNLVAKNQSGSVNAEDIAGTVRATTSFSSMDIEGSGPSFVCRNQSGHIRLRAKSDQLSNVDLTTSFGSLDVTLPHSVSPVIEAQTSFGKIQSDFPVQTEPATDNAVVNTAGNAPRVKLHNQSGSIRIARE